MASLGFAQGKTRKWLDIDKSQGAPLIVRKVAPHSIEASQPHACNRKQCPGHVWGPSLEHNLMLHVFCRRIAYRTRHRHC